MEQCKHYYIHIDTSYVQYSSRGVYNSTWKRIDRYYCSICLEEKEVVKMETERSQPDWFDGRNCRTVND